LESTTRLLAACGASEGTIYGRFKDIDIYSAILDADFEGFIDLAEELGQAFLRRRVEYVVGDAIEGYNPIHDLCRNVINTAVELANRRKANPIANFDFLVIGQPDLKSDVSRGEEIWLRLDEAALARKLEAAKSYLELKDDVAKMINEAGSAAFQFEALRPAGSAFAVDGPVQEPPFYERYGEKQVSEGYYHRVIRYREHILPIVEELRDHAKR
jgi:AcrR family transcriptional regulator